MIGTCFLRRGDQSLVEYTEVLAKVRFFLIQVPKLTTLRSRDLAKIGQIAYPQLSFKGLGIEDLYS